MKTNKKRYLLTLLSGVGILIIGFAAIYIFFVYQRNQQVKAEIASRIPYPETSSDDGSNMIQFNGKTWKRNTYMKAILCMGIDSDGDMLETKVAGSGGQADGIFLIAQDTARNQVKILMIPRDTMTPITLTDLSGNVLAEDRQHITLAFAYGDGREKSCEYMKKAVSRLLSGLEIDSYIAINTSAVSIMNDAVGGVDVTVPIEGMEQRDPSLTKGSQVQLHGKQAEIFVRFRDTNKDFSAIDRMGVQEEYILGFQSAIRRESRKNSNIVTDMMSEISPYMITDMSREQYLKVMMDTLQSQDINQTDILQIPGESVTTQMFDEFHPDLEQTEKLILDLFYREAS